MTKKIAVFDSGLGGLSAFRELNLLLPDRDLIYFGDTARVPYGNRSDALIREFARQDLNFLLRQTQGDLEAVLVACGTVSSVALPALRAMTSVPVLGVVDATAKAAVKATKNGKIGVLGTAATVRSNSYGKAISALNPACDVVSNACPLFVPLVENGYLDRPVTELVARDYVQPLSDCDTVILGCTHFPLLKDVLSRLLPSATLIDAGRESALALSELCPSAGNAGGTRSYYVTDKVADFSRIAEIFLRHPLDGPIEQVTL